jgi:hypothetical protein
MSINPGSRISLDPQDARSDDLACVDVEQPGGLEREHQLDHRLPKHLDPGRPAVGYARLLPRLDRE